MQNMNRAGLKESVKHGSSLLPAECYDVRGSVVCHWHDELELMKVIRGTVNIKQNERLFTAKEGDIFFFTGGTLHAAEPACKEEDVHCISIVFHPDILCQSDAIKQKYVDPVLNKTLEFKDNYKGYENVSEHFDKLTCVLKNRTDAYELLARAHILSIYSILIGSAKKISEPRIQRTSEQIKMAISYVNECFEKEITIADLSSVCGISEGHFCRLFKEATLKTPTQYINAVRIRRAAELIRTTDKCITDIAFEVGFNSHSYFTKTFGALLGVTPLDYKRRSIENTEVL